MTYLEKKLLKKFLLVFAGALILAWVNGRPIPIKNADQKIMGEVCNEDLKVYEVVNEVLKLEDSEAYIKFKELLKSDSFDDFSKNLEIQEFILDFNTDGILNYGKYRENAEKGKKELEQIVHLINTTEFTNRIVSKDSDDARLRVNYTALIGILLNEVYASWDSDKEWSFRCLTATRRLISNLSSKVLIRSVEYSALYNVIYNLTLFDILKAKEVDAADLQRIIEISEGNKFKISRDRILEVCKADQKFRLYTTVKNPDSSFFSSTIKIRLKTFTFDMAEIFNDIDELYSIIVPLLDEKDWAVKVDEILKNDPAPRGGAFAFVTENVEKKRKLNNWLLKGASRFVIKTHLNSLQNINNLGIYFDSLTKALIHIKLFNKLDGSINKDLIEDLKKAPGLTIKQESGKLVADLKFDYQTIDGVFSLIKDKFRIEIFINDEK